MLVVTRREGERINIGSNIIVTILGFRAGQVKIGIDAPRDVQVHREEVFQRIQTQLGVEDELGG